MCVMKHWCILYVLKLCDVWVGITRVEWSDLVYANFWGTYVMWSLLIRFSLVQDEIKREWEIQYKCSDFYLRGGCQANDNDTCNDNDDRDRRERLTNVNKFEKQILLMEFF